MTDQQQEQESDPTSPPDDPLPVDLDSDKDRVNDGNLDGCESEERPRKSLNSIYGNRHGFWQSLSLVLNAGVMVYAHVGLSAVILLNQQRISEQQDSPAADDNPNSPSIVPGTNLTGDCSAEDLEVWNARGALNKTKESNWCAREYKGGGCLLDPVCTEECFVNVWNYTAPCAACFADIPFCSLGEGCAFICQADGESEECSICTEPCNALFDECSGLPRPEVTFVEDPAATLGPTPDSMPSNIADETSEEICERQKEGVDAANVKEYYVVYELMFFQAVKTAWTSDARLLAVIVVLFSGIWRKEK